MEHYHPRTLPVIAMQQQDGSLATSTFQCRLPSVLQSASPSLAALHATRARLLHYPDPTGSIEVLFASRCMKCGTFLFDGSGTIRSVRKALPKKRRMAPQTPRYTRVLRKTCNVCGHTADLPIRLDNGVNSPITHSASPSAHSSRLSSRHNTPIEPKPSAENRAHPTTSDGRASKSNPPSGMALLTSSGSIISSTKSRPKKHRGLQDMLARNRERQEQAKNAKSHGQNLSTFLEGVE